MARQPYGDRSEASASEHDLSKPASEGAIPPPAVVKIGTRYVFSAIAVPRAAKGRVEVSIEVHTEGSATHMTNFTAKDGAGKDIELEPVEKQEAMAALGVAGQQSE